MTAILKNACRTKNACTVSGLSRVWTSAELRLASLTDEEPHDSGSRVMLPPLDGPHVYAPARIPSHFSEDSAPPGLHKVAYRYPAENQELLLYK